MADEESSEAILNATTQPDVRTIFVELLGEVKKMNENFTNIPIMTEKLLKETKISRTNAKAALTSAGKSLHHLIESKRPGKEIGEVLSKVLEAYDKLIENHEEFTKLIEDDKEFEEQEAWLEESQYIFLSLETDTKLYLESTEELPKESPIKENGHNDIENSLEDTSNSELTRSSITKSDNVVSINSATELINVENNASAVSEVVKEGIESVEVIEKETCSFKMEKPKNAKVFGGC